jgi:uncharacterized membrane protein YecN with MAPEG domain
MTIDGPSGMVLGPGQPAPVRRDVRSSAHIRSAGKNIDMVITPLYAGILALWFLVLSARVVQQRGHGVSLGDGGDTELLRRIRGHGNFSEYVPLILLMMAMQEQGGQRAWLLHALGATLVVARLLHGYALSFSQSFKFGRFHGTSLTFILLAVNGLLCFWQGLRAF